ncbi:MAG TPA: hypothetical protein VEZ90_05115 [Blastocatellia bacterium]|nr:hypothetical protein [Blastocatellia bacterium]
MPSTTSEELVGEYHSFLLVSEIDVPYSRILKLQGEPAAGAAIVHNDQLAYISDSLLWIPSFNPAKKMVGQMGLNLFGLTVIQKDGAAVAERILRAWTDLFGCGPSVLHLTGSYTFEPEGPPDGRYEEIVVERAVMVDWLVQLESFCHRIAAGDGTDYLLHRGI